MAQQKEKLKLLLQFIDQVANQSGNEWFRDELTKKFSNNTASKGNSGLDVLIDDIKRTKLYLKNIDKSLQCEGFKFYKNIKDIDLKKQLVSDYKEMKISFINNDILEYGRRMALQMERCFDFAISVVNGWEIVNCDSKYNEISIPSGKFEQKVRVKSGFYKPDFNNKSILLKKDVSEIEFKVKAAFCGLFYQINFFSQWSNLNDIYFLRNKASHGSVTTKDLDRLNKIIEGFAEKNGFYHKMFCSFVNPLKDIYETKQY